MPKKSQQTKSKRRVPVDAKWCLENANNLTPQSFFEQFNHVNQSKGNTRYRNIIRKWIPDEKRGVLLKALKNWQKSEKAVSFWKDRCICDSTTIVESGSEHEDEEIPKSRYNINGIDVSKILFDYRRSAIKIFKTQGLIFENNITELAACFNMILITNDQNNSFQVKYFGGTLLERIKECNHFDYTLSMTDTIYLAISRIIYDIQRGVLILEKGMIKLLELSVKEEVTIYEKNLLKGIACMLNFLPKKEVDVAKLGESELWSTYYNPLLTSILSKTQDNILLRWANKADESYPLKRPDAVISALSNNRNLCLGYGECKLGNVSKKALNMDIVKLAIFTQRNININNKQNVFSYNIDGFKVNFFVTSIENEHVYVMKKVGEVVLPCCLDDLPSFINMKTINDILQITKYFWEVCNTDLDVSQVSWKKEIKYDEYLEIIVTKKSTVLSTPE